MHEMAHKHTVTHIYVCVIDSYTHKLCDCTFYSSSYLFNLQEYQKFSDICKYRIQNIPVIEGKPQ